MQCVHAGDVARRDSEYNPNTSRDRAPYLARTNVERLVIVLIMGMVAYGLQCVAPIIGHDLVVSANGTRNVVINIIYKI